MAKKVLCVLTNKFEEIETIGTYALLKRGGVSVDLVALNETRIVGKFDLVLSELKTFDTIDVDNYDCLFIAGGNQYAELSLSERFIKLVFEFNKKGKLIAAICAAPTILGELGLLKGLKYTCYNLMNEDFGGEYIDHYVVQDKNIITGKSAAATIDFAFTILEALCGKEVSEEIKNQIYYYNR